MALGIPSATAGPSALADYLELRAFSVADRSSSLQDLIQGIRRTGTSEEFGAAEYADDVAVDDDGGTKSEASAEDAFAEIEDRQMACGATSVYPFAIEARCIQLQPGCEETIYTFLLLLSHYGLKAGPKGAHPERLFEDICRVAAANYLGGEAHGGRALHFGFPRRILPKAFPSALRDLMREIKDGLPNDDAPKTKDQKDAKLDIVAWKDFPDGRQGKIIAYGQCAVGKTDWRDKVHELQPASFHKKWLREHPSVDPVRFFFVPFRVESDAWRLICIDGGVLFDRCRVAAFAGNIDAVTESACAEWSRFVLTTNLR